jgi:circadian clock protein KaiB
MGEMPVQIPLRLRLYVSGAAPESVAVEANLRRVCEEVGLLYEVEVLDVREHPDEAEADRVVLTPTLIRLTPPQLRVAGDLSDVEAAMDGLGLRVWGLSLDGNASTDGTSVRDAVGAGDDPAADAATGGATGAGGAPSPGP